AQVQRLQRGKQFQYSHRALADAASAERQALESGEGRKVFQATVGDSRIGYIERFQLAEFPHDSQRVVGNLRAAHIQPLQLPPAFDRIHAQIGDQLGVKKIQVFDLAGGLQAQ